MSVKEFLVNPEDNSKRIMYLVKEILLAHDSVDIIASTASAHNAARAAETLHRLNYITYDNVRTDTSVVENRRRTKLVIGVRKTTQFKALYDENEAKRKQFQEEKEKALNTKTTPSN